VVSLCASSIDHIATFLFLNQSRAAQAKNTVVRIQSHIMTEPEILGQLMNTLFNSLLYSSAVNHWSITRPILSLMLSSEASFTQYRDALLGSQREENQEKLVKEFETLLTGLQHSLETAHRDRFTQKLNMFRLQVRSFLNL